MTETTESATEVPRITRQTLAAIQEAEAAQCNGGHDCPVNHAAITPIYPLIRSIVERKVVCVPVEEIIAATLEVASLNPRRIVACRRIVDRMAGWLLSQSESTQETTGK